MLSSQIKNLLSSISNGDRVALSKAITLIESKKKVDRNIAQEVIIHLPDQPTTIRMAISGAPGVGKSTFIEALGLFLIEKGLRPAILTVDPSSHVSGGSILGDRTRMEELSRSDVAYIRQSPSSNFLGGAARRTRETILLCEHAGFDVVIVETVGVGQSEYVAGQLTDLFTLLIQPGSGDDLQGVKRGVMEMADLLVVTKADGTLKDEAIRSKRFLITAAHMLQSKSHDQPRSVLSTSALNKSGLDEFWRTAISLFNKLLSSGYIDRNRASQKSVWLQDIIQETWLDRLYDNPKFEEKLAVMDERVRTGQINVYTATKELLEIL